jgi:3-dehydroquinate synthase
MSTITASSSSMTGPDRLTVELGARAYDILVGQGLIEDAGRLLQDVIRQPRAVLLSDEHLRDRGHLERLSASLSAAGIVHEAIVVPPGESSKSFARLEDVLDRCLGFGLERRTALVALGGGVVGDLGGLAAALLLRGLDYVQIPTTLLAQVDSAVGGKTGINSRHGKNLIGAFHQPRLVLADTAVLDSLPARELRAGYAEVVKYGLIDQPDFFAWLETNGAALLAGDAEARRHAVVTSCAAKARVVAADERESGQRALLNLGHTFGHALERITGYTGELLHGEAVAIGMVMAFRLSAELGLCPEADLDRVTAHLAAVDLPTSRRHLQTRITTEAMLAAMNLDKKVVSGRPRFVLARGIGKAFADAEVEPEALKALLDAAEN